MTALAKCEVVTSSSRTRNSSCDFVIGLNHIGFWSEGAVFLIAVITVDPGSKALCLRLRSDPSVRIIDIFYHMLIAACLWIGVRFEILNDFTESMKDDRC